MSSNLGEKSMIEDWCDLKYGMLEALTCSDPSGPTPSAVRCFSLSMLNCLESSGCAAIMLVYIRPATSTLWDSSIGRSSFSTCR